MIFIIGPVFIIAVLMGVESWLWKVVIFAITAASWYFFGPAYIAVVVLFIIGIAIKNSLSKISGSKI